MYINLHLIVQKFDFVVYPGKIFFEIVNFFDMLLSKNPAAKKLLKDILNNMDFKSGLDKVASMLEIDGYDKNSKKKYERRKNWN